MHQPLALPTRENYMFLMTYFVPFKELKQALHHNGALEHPAN